jgi:hypothetical protein
MDSGRYVHNGVFIVSRQYKLSANKLANFSGLGLNPNPFLDLYNVATDDWREIFCRKRWQE